MDLWDAAKNGNLDEIRRLIEQKANIDERDPEYGQTPLSWASEKGQVDAIKCLVEMKANIEAKDNSGQTPLSCASYNGQVDAIKCLAEMKANIEAKDDCDKTPLDLARGNNEVKAVEYLEKVVRDRGKTEREPQLSSVDQKEHTTHQGYAVCEIRGRVGGSVDRVTFVYRDGKTQTWGGEGGGEAQPFVLRESESVCKVTACHSAKFRGGWIRFSTTAGRETTLKGSGWNPEEAPDEQVVEFTVPSGHVVVGLQWSTEDTSARDAKLVGIVVARKQKHEKNELKEEAGMKRLEAEEAQKKRQKEAERKRKEMEEADISCLASPLPQLYLAAAQLLAQPATIAPAYGPCANLSGNASLIKLLRSRMKALLTRGENMGLDGSDKNESGSSVDTVNGDVTKTYEALVAPNKQLGSTLAKYKTAKGEERSRCKSVIKGLISQRHTIFTETKASVETELKRVSVLFTEPDKITKEAKGIMGVSYRAYSAAEATYGVLQPLLSSYFIDPNDTMVGDDTEALRKKLGSKLAECKSALGALATAEKEKHKAMDAFVAGLESKDSKAKNKTPESKIGGEYPGVDWIHDSFARAKTSSSLWKDTTLVFKKSKVKLAAAIEGLGQAAAELLVAEFRDLKVAHTETVSASSSVSDILSSMLGKLRSRKTALDSLKAHVARYESAKTRVKECRDILKNAHKEELKLKGELERLKSADHLDDDFGADSDSDDFGSSNPSPGTANSQGSASIESQIETIKQKIKRIRKAPGVLRARAQLLRMSSLMPELLYHHPDLDPFAGTGAQGICVRAIEDYTDVKLLDQDNQSREGGIYGNRAQLFSAVLNLSAASTGRGDGKETKKDPLAALIKGMLDADADTMAIHRSCRAQGYTPANVARTMQKIKFPPEAKTSEDSKADTSNTKKLCVLKRFGLGVWNLKPLRRAVHVMSSIKHKNIVPLVGMCRDSEQRWMLQMPMYAGDMKAWAQREFKKAQDAKPQPTTPKDSGIKDATPMEIFHARVSVMLRGVLEGLQFLHHAGIVHRDLKPSNILVGPPMEHGDANNGKNRQEHQEFAVITDFDTCKVEKKGSDLTATITKMQGTQGYMDPQVSIGTFLPSPSSDMFAFGVTLAEILTGCTRKINSAQSVKSAAKSGMVTEAQAQLLTALLRPLPTGTEAKSARGRNSRPTAAQVMSHPFFSRPAALLKRTCCLCGDEVSISECITCANTDVDSGNSAVDPYNHSTCHECFNHHVTANSKDSEKAKFIARKGYVGCPLSYGGTSAKCASKHFSDVEVAVNTETKTFDVYIAAKNEIAEIKVTRKLEKEHKANLIEEIEIFKKLDAKNKEIYQARTHITTNILVCVGGDPTKPPSHEDHYGPWTLDPCPRCKVGFAGFTACFAVKCEECGPCGFCGWCLADCGSDAHSHVLNCPHNKNPGSYYGTIEQYNSAKRGRITLKLRAYLNRKGQISSDVVKSIAVGLKKFGFEHIVREYAPTDVGNGESGRNRANAGIGQYDADFGLQLLQEEADALA